jgi:rhamnogalacturonyl hydrolase YesR
VYGLAIGVQLGILDAAEYWPVTKKGFDALLDMRQTSGRLGYMQAVGYDANGYPGEAAVQNTANAFGYGLFIHAAAAIMRMCSDYETPELSVPPDGQYGAAKVPEYRGVKD